MHKHSRRLIFLIDVAFALLVSGLVAINFVAAEVTATGGNMLQLDVIAGRLVVDSPAASYAGPGDIRER